MRSARIEGRLGNGDGRALVGVGLDEPCEPFLVDADRGDGLGIDPGARIDRLVGGRDLEGQALGSGEVDRAAEAVVDGSEHVHPPRPDAVADRDQGFVVVDVEGEVLEGARGGRLGRVARVRPPNSTSIPAIAGS